VIKSDAMSSRQLSMSSNRRPRHTTREHRAAAAEPALPGRWRRPLGGEATAGRFGGGARQLVVVLLAAMAIAIAYTNRHLVMEQKTAANQQRSTIAAEAAEAGLEWAAAMLNKQEKVNAACTTSTANGDVRFKARYISVNTDTGMLTPLAGTTHAACVWSGSAWSCSCPVAGTAPSLSVSGSGSRPGFAVTFIASPETPPAAALTARGYVSIGNAALGVVNGDPSSNGITINAGMTIDADRARVTTVPGTPPHASLVGNDASLRNTTEAQMFSTFFGMTKESYQALPSIKRLTCPCTETHVKTAYDEGVRQFWLDGNLEMNANLTIGSESDPVLMIVDGNVRLQGDLRVFGVIYSTSMTWDNTGGGSALLQGAAISEGNYTGNGSPDYFYDPRVLSRLRYDQASFVRVPGSWRDF
jgi:hypothetical protein